MTSGEIQHRVIQVLGELVAEREFERIELSLETRLVDDMGRVLGLREFPMQSWVNDEAKQTGPRFTVRSLVATCERTLANAGSEAIAV